MVEKCKFFTLFRYFCKQYDCVVLKLNENNHAPKAMPEFRIFRKRCLKFQCGGCTSKR
jgi:hypothetical protein